MEPKGLPDDLPQKHFFFCSTSANMHKNYEKGTTRKVKLPNGEYANVWDKRFEKPVVSEEEAKKYKGFHRGENNQIFVYDFASQGGELVDVPNAELYATFEEFIEASHYDDEYDEEMQDYGYWQIDFDCCDYHSHSYLTLKELEEYDHTDYNTTRCEVSKKLYDKFIELGGAVPEGMNVITDINPSDVIECIRYAFEPEVIVTFCDKKFEETPLGIGIKELQEIADKYGVGNEDIRIVFAFDN
jgi:hypothetical protein